MKKLLIMSARSQSWRDIRSGSKRLASGLLVMICTSVGATMVTSAAEKSALAATSQSPLPPLPTPLAGLSPAVERPGLGACAWEVSGGTEVAQWLRQGMVLLYHEWTTEALRTFYRAVQVDPDSVLGWWGLVMSIPGSDPEWAAFRQQAVQRALSLREKGTQREKLWLATLEPLVTGGPEKAIPAWQRLAQEFPTDHEARVWLASFLAQPGYAPTGHPAAAPAPTARHTVGVRLVEEVLRLNPDHIGAHLALIRLTEGTQEHAKTIPLIKRLAELAPGAGSVFLFVGRSALQEGQPEAAQAALTQAVVQQEAYLKAESLSPADHVLCGQAHRQRIAAEVAVGDKPTALKYAREFAGLNMPLDRPKAEGVQHFLIHGQGAEIWVHLACRDWPQARQLAEPFLAKAGMSYVGLLGLEAQARLRLAQPPSPNSPSAQVAMAEYADGVSSFLSDAAAPSQVRGRWWREAAEALPVQEALLASEAAAADGALPEAVEALLSEASLRAQPTLALFPPLLSQSPAEQEGWFWLRQKDQTRAQAAFKRAGKPVPPLGK